MLLVAIKFVEVFTRAAFVVGTSYSLSLAGAGQFGIVATVVGLGAFAFNWERHQDFQRRYVNAEPEILDRAVGDAFQFWGFNQLVMMPFFLVACGLMAKLDAWQLLLVAVIASGEQVSNQTYHLAMISSRYRLFVIIVAAKNIAVLLAVLPFVLFAPSKLTLDYALGVWASGQLVGSALILGLWLWRNVAVPHETPWRFASRIFAQHRASFTHLQIGLVAVLMLQFDRLAIGALVPLDQAGVYFRHILIVSFVYQFVSVAFYGRALPRVFAAAKTQGKRVLQAMMRGELATIYAILIGGAGVLIAVDLAAGHLISERFSLAYPLGLILFGGALVRVAADLQSLICNARHAERDVLRAQIAAFAIGGPWLVVLSWAHGIFGTAIASATTSLVYLILMARAAHRLPERPLS